MIHHPTHCYRCGSARPADPAEAERVGWRRSWPTYRGRYQGETWTCPTCRARRQQQHQAELQARAEARRQCLERLRQSRS